MATCSRHRGVWRRGSASEGLRRGDRVAVFMDNTWPCAVSIFGILLAGGTFLVVNPQTKADKLQYILRDSGAFALISDGRLARIYLPALAKVPVVRCLICSGTLPQIQMVECSIVSFTEATAGEALPFSTRESETGDLAALIYTSGSSGNPKGVMMTHHSMAFTVGSLIQYLRLDENDRILNILPLAFDYGLYQFAALSVRLRRDLGFSSAPSFIPGKS